jgi:hypothetical protein
MEACRCQSCGKPTVVPGHLVGTEGSQVWGFVPALTRSQVMLRVAFHACVSCGHVWAKVEPAEVRNAIEKRGKELIKQHLETCVSGPYRDLPDVPEARSAAEGVAEIDYLILAGNQLDATRRFRQLSGCIWDEAIDLIRGWVGLERAHKLVLLGWRPQGKDLDNESGRLQDHPMRDRVLDG